MSNANKGMYFGFKWSSDYLSKTPWTLSGNPVRYVGITSGVDGVTMVTLGPVAIVVVRID